MMSNIPSQLMLIAILSLLFQEGTCFCSIGQFQDSSGLCNTCPINTYTTLNNATSCQLCSNCTNCFSTSGTCTNCFPGEQPQGMNCTQCPDKSFSPGYLACQPCSESCFSCSSSDGACLSCNPGFEPNASSLCSSCLVGFFSAGGANICQQCTTSCSGCDPTNGSCTCESGLQPSSDGQTCVVCNIQNCISCALNNSCGICILNYEPVNGVCFFCGVNFCDACQNTSGSLECSACISGYSLDTSGKLCDPECPTANCLICSVPNVCSICDPGFFLDSINNLCSVNCGIDFCASCVNTITCERCFTNYALLDSSCVLICSIENCLTCVEGVFGECQTCVTGLIPSTDSTRCVVCNVANCQSCTENNICGQCSGNLLLMNGECFDCQVDNCASCLANNFCQQCQRGYSLNEGQCIACLQPCQMCNADGSCAVCSSPYNISPGVDNMCFLCYDLNCINCTNSSLGGCLECHQDYSLADGLCTKTCAVGCTSCVDPSFCQVCQSQFYYFQNNSCLRCSSSPPCLTCTSGGCTSCIDGHFLSSSSQCQRCQSYCRVCISANKCSSLFNSQGFTLVDLNSTVNIIAACDPSCSSCSSSNPVICTSCLFGFYLQAEKYCLPCEEDSFCASCSAANASVCLSCFAGYFLTGSVCQVCSFPCTSCLSGSPSLCQTCAQGYFLIQDTNICLSNEIISNNIQNSPVQNCANEVMKSINGVTSFSCTLCLQGYTLTSFGCVPCPIGCLICNQNSLTECIECSPGYLLLDKNCVLSSVCPEKCSSCSQLGCTSCIEGFFLNQDLTCQKKCSIPCSSCLVNDIFSCTACIAGYTLSGTYCLPDVNCSTSKNCKVCPFGHTLFLNNTVSSVSQICIACTQSLNCARCLPTNISHCTSCLSGMYLNISTCLECQEGCAQCIHFQQCTSCAEGYLPTQSGAILVNSASGLLNCTPCAFPCSSCLGNPTFCTTCPSGFTLLSSLCLSNFHFQIQATFDTSLALLKQKYLSLLSQIASTAGVSTHDVGVTSIFSGSVILRFVVNSFDLPGSDQAIQAESNLKNIFSGSSIAGLSINSYSVSAEGGDNSSQEGLSSSGKIALATVLPLGIIAIIVVAVLLYQKYKRDRGEEPEGRPKMNTGWSVENRERRNTGRSISARGKANQRSEMSNRSRNNTGHSWENRSRKHTGHNMENPSDYSTGRNLEASLYHSKSGYL